MSLTDSFFNSRQSLNDRMLALVNGVYFGIVTDNKDPENLGRIKVKIPIIDKQNSLDWARMTTVMSGNKFGTLFIPEVGDEVLVAFHMGDIRQPIIIGCLWNKKAPPPSGMDAKNNIRKITSRAGHEVILDDTQGSGKITLKTKSGQQIELAESSDSVQIKDKSGQNSLTIKGGASGEIELKSGSTKISINNKGDVVIESMKGVKLKSTQISIEANATLDLKGTAAVNLKSDGLVNIKGSIVKIN